MLGQQQQCRQPLMQRRCEHGRHRCTPDDSGCLLLACSGKLEKKAGTAVALQFTMVHLMMMRFTMVLSEMAQTMSGFVCVTAHVLHRRWSSLPSWRGVA